MLPCGCADDTDQAVTISEEGGVLTALQHALTQTLNRTEIDILKASLRGDSHDWLVPALFSKLIRAALRHAKWPRILPDFAQVRAGGARKLEPPPLSHHP